MEILHFIACVVRFSSDALLNALLDLWYNIITENEICERLGNIYFRICLINIFRFGLCVRVSKIDTPSKAAELHLLLTNLHQCSYIEFEI